MSAADWITLIIGLLPSLLVIGGVGAKLITQITRLTDAVRALGKREDAIAGIVADHENRLNRARL